MTAKFHVHTLTNPITGLDHVVRPDGSVETHQEVVARINQTYADRAYATTADQRKADRDEARARNRSSR